MGIARLFPFELLFLYILYFIVVIVFKSVKNKSPRRCYDRRGDFPLFFQVVVLTITLHRPG